MPARRSRRLSQTAFDNHLVRSPSNKETAMLMRHAPGLRAALELTRAGKLAAATQAIQRAIADPTGEASRPEISPKLIDLASDEWTVKEAAASPNPTALASEHQTPAPVARRRRHAEAFQTGWTVPHPQTCRQATPAAYPGRRAFRNPIDQSWGRHSKLQGLRSGPGPGGAPLIADHAAWLHSGPG